MNDDTEWVSGEIRLNISGHPLDLKMTVPAKPTTVRRMLPVFQKMSNSFVQLSVDAVESRGKSISCKAGCGACCRQAVPLAEPEAYAIAEMVAEMPEPKRTAIREKFEKACAHFEEIGWFDRFDQAGSMTPKERNDHVTAYLREGVPCPFLEDESCSIHERRPMICREYLVTSQPAHCASPTPGSVEGVPLLVSPSAVFFAVTRRSLEDSPVNFVLMIKALEWAESMPEDETKRTGEEWMAEFFKNLTKKDIPGFKDSTPK